MRFLHIADLHFGKQLHGVSLLENKDQPYWVDRFLELAEKTRPDAVLIAGDVYDRSSPSGEAVALLDRLLTGLVKRGFPVLMVAGNHDSGQRLAFGGELLSRQRLFIAGSLGGQGVIPKVTLADEYGPVNFYLLPYIFPALVARALGDEEIRDYDAAIRRLIAAQALDPKERNVIIAHQNVTAFGQEGEWGGSESMVGGVGRIDASAFDLFDYGALGHIHAAYPVGRPSLRYAGSPLCYHFDETRQAKKGPLLVSLGPKGAEVEVERLFIEPLHPMREMKGSYEDLKDGLLSSKARGEYLRLVLTDQRVSPEAAALFRGICEQRGSILMELVSTFREFEGPAMGGGKGQGGKDLAGLFADFYRERSEGEEPDEEELRILREAQRLVLDGGEGERPGPAEADRLLLALMGKEALL